MCWQYFRLFESVEQLEELLTKLLNEGGLIIKWERKVIAGGRGQGAGGSFETLEFQWFYLLFMS